MLESGHSPAYSYLFNVINKKNQNNIQNLLKVTIKTLKWCQWLVLLSLLLTLKRFHTLSWCFHCWHWPSNCRLDICHENVPITSFETISRLTHQKTSRTLTSFLHSTVKLAVLETSIIKASVILIITRFIYHGCA